MTDKEYEDMKQKVRASVATWRDRLGLQDYLIHIDYVRGICEEVPERAAITNVFWVYRDAYITFYLEQMLNSYKSIDEIVAHELTHILLAPISCNLEEGYEQQNEFVTENIAQLFIKKHKEEK